MIAWDQPPATHISASTYGNGLAAILLISRTHRCAATVERSPYEDSP